MANCERKDPPVFTEEVQKWDRETVADGDAMGLVIQLFNNTVFNRRTAEKAAGSLITGITIPASGWKDLTYTIENAAIEADSIVHIGMRLIRSRRPRRPIYGGGRKLES